MTSVTLWSSDLSSSDQLPVLTSGPTTCVYVYSCIIGLFIRPFQQCLHKATTVGEH